jgi:hypothetical protein
MFKTVLDCATGEITTVPLTPEEIAEAEAAAAAWEDSQSPVEAEPVRVACALRVPVVDGAVQQLGGAYRVAGLFLVGTGSFMAVFTQDLGDEPYLVPNNGISIEITEWGGDYAMLEVRDHAGGTLITPASFGFSLYQL